MGMSTKDFANQIRVSALRMVTAAKASHIGSALSIADIVAVLYGKILNTNSDHAEFVLRDRFILSKGHACVVVYAALSKLGFFPEEELKNYGKDYSNLMNHISHKVPGVEFSTGSLGHGLPFGVGKALFSKKYKKDWKVFVLLSDGELDEGSNWEALMFAAHHRLNNLTAIIDYNKLQSLTSIENTLRLEPLADKFRAFGANVHEVDGHDHEQLLSVFQQQSEAPKVIIAHTIKGKGVSFMENQVLWHYRSPSSEQLAQAIAEINLSDRD
jgi:transketolase